MMPASTAVQTFHRVEPLPLETARKVASQYVCSACWGVLRVEPLPDAAEAYVLCRKCETPGYIRIKTAERIRAEAFEKAAAARRNLREALEIQFPGKNLSTYSLFKTWSHGMTAKTQIAFPEVGIIRKGTPKRKNPKKSDQMMQGADLGRFFRLAFAPGTEDVKAAWAAIHPETIKKYGPDYAEPDGFEVARIRCMIVTRNVSEAWEWANEAYSAGRLIARADDEHFITLRNPLTGEYEVENGEPYTPFKHGQEIAYERDGRKFSLPIRTYGRLSLFIPELGRMVRLTLKTTSYYDRLNISANLNAIQFIADTLNGGNAAGIPFFLYRREQEITWNKPDGGALRVKKWLVCVEADPEWVSTAVQRIGTFALGISPRALLPEPITGTVDPDNAEDEESSQVEADQAETIQEADFVDGDLLEPGKKADALTEKYEQARTVKTPLGILIDDLPDSRLELLSKTQQTSVSDEMRQAARTILAYRIAHQITK